MPSIPTSVMATAAPSSSVIVSTSTSSPTPSSQQSTSTPFSSTTNTPPPQSGFNQAQNNSHLKNTLKSKSNTDTEPPATPTHLKSTSTTSLSTTHSNSPDLIAEAVSREIQRNEDVAECILGMSSVQLEDEMLDGEFSYHMAVYAVAEKERRGLGGICW